MKQYVFLSLMSAMALSACSLTDDTTHQSVTQTRSSTAQIKKACENSFANSNLSKFEFDTAVSKCIRNRTQYQ